MVGCLVTEAGEVFEGRCGVGAERVVFVVQVDGRLFFFGSYFGFGSDC